ncbi:MAG: hypothetical protein U0105_13400 [Candidatus Obscuribacterales bacterium]
MQIELYGGPHDGMTVDCPLVPPQCLLLPEIEHKVGCIYWYDSLDLEDRATTFKYIFSGYQALEPEEQAALGLT